MFTSKTIILEVASIIKKNMPSIQPSLSETVA